MFYNLAAEGSLPNGVSPLYLFQTRLKSEIPWALLVGEMLVFSYFLKNPYFYLKIFYTFGGGFCSHTPVAMAGLAVVCGVPFNLKTIPLCSKFSIQQLTNQVLCS